MRFVAIKGLACGGGGIGTAPHFLHQNAETSRLPETL